MLTFSTCTACGESLAVTFVGQMTHPTCPSHEDERLAREFCDAVQREDEKEIIRLEKLLNAPRPEPKLGPSALWYAKHGWPVFPVRPGEKVPATKNGFRDATREPSQIKAWWGSRDYNIGIPTGLSGAGFDAIDVDGNLGMRSLVELGDDAIPEVHGKVLTPRGFHLLVKGTNDGNRVGVKPGIDYRSSGGFVLTVPSIVDGKRYSWATPPSPEILKEVV